jgi:hypothetical protein
MNERKLAQGASLESEALTNQVMTKAILRHVHQQLPPHTSEA